MVIFILMHVYHVIFLGSYSVAGWPVENIHLSPIFHGPRICDFSHACIIFLTSASRNRGWISLMHGKSAKVEWMSEAVVGWVSMGQEG